MITHDTPTSTNISRLKYDDQIGTLYIEFRSGKEYKYEGVDYETWNNFISAPSAGQYFNSVIKNRFKGIPV